MEGLCVWCSIEDSADIKALEIDEAVLVLETKVAVEEIEIDEEIDEKNDTTIISTCSSLTSGSNSTSHSIDEGMEVILEYAQSCGKDSRMLAAWRQLSFEKNKDILNRSKCQSSMCTYFSKKVTQEPNNLSQNQLLQLRGDNSYSNSQLVNSVIFHDDDTDETEVERENQVERNGEDENDWENELPMRSFDRNDNDS